LQLDDIQSGSCLVADLNTQPGSLQNTVFFFAFLRSAKTNILSQDLQAQICFLRCFFTEKNPPNGGT